MTKNEHKQITEKNYEAIKLYVARDMIVDYFNEIEITPNLPISFPELKLKVSLDEIGMLGLEILKNDYGYENVIYGSIVNPMSESKVPIGYWLITEETGSAYSAF